MAESSHLVVLVAPRGRLAGIRDALQDWSAVGLLGPVCWVEDPPEEGGGRVAATEIVAGADLLILGDMGIGNTTPATALIAATFGVGSAEVVGRGTGVDDARLAHKTAVIAAALKRLTKPELMAKCESLGLPFAPIGRPAELFDDPHLTQSGGLVPLTLPNGAPVALPALPISLDGARPGAASDLRPPGADGEAIAREFERYLKRRNDEG